MNDHLETRIERRPVKKPRACHLCHSRKVRCDAWQVGVPCTGCRRRNKGRTCVLVASIANPERLPSTRDIQPRDSQHPQHSAASRACEGQPQEASDPDGSSGHLNRCPSPPVDPAAPQLVAHGAHHRHTVPEPTDAHDHSQAQMVDLLCHNDPETPDATSTVTSVDEEDVHLRLAEDMSREFVGVVSPTEPRGEDECCEVIEYHEGVTPVTILGEALGKRQPNRLTCVKLRGAADGGFDLTSGTASFDLVDTAYLRQKGALELPPQKLLTQLLHLYFKCVFPYAPILEPSQLLQDYYVGRHSPFLMQSILAGVIPHTPVELLNEMGYQDRIAAQKSFYSRATLVYDLGHERSQLSRLQGSIMLSSLSFSYAHDKDYRYWFSNACRIATQMGLHRQYISERLDPTTKKLFRRIWWTLYNRDVLMAVSGLSNLKRFDDRFCDTAVLTEDDWVGGEIPDDLSSVVPPTTRLHRVYMVENSKLGVICSRFLSLLKRPGSEPSADEVKGLESDLVEWKKRLDPEISVGTWQEWSADNIWILVLLAISFRLEAVFYRALREYYDRRGDPKSASLVSQKQENVMFELSAIIQRASLHQVIGLCPLSFMTCASTILAMRIETALSPETSARRRLAARVQIFAELEYLREGCHHWTSLKWTLRMFEAAILRTGLSLDGGSSTTESVLGQGAAAARDSRRHGAPQENSSGFHPRTEAINMELGDEATLFGALDLPDVDENADFFGVLPVTGDYDWMEALRTPAYGE